MIPRQHKAVAILLAFFMMIPGARAGHYLNEYWSIGDYVREHPDQNALMRDFGAAVAAAAVPVPEALRTKTTKQPVRITIVYPGLQASDYWRRSVASFRARLDDLGIAYTIASTFTRPGKEISKQTEAIAEALKNNPDYLVFTLDAKQHQYLIGQIIRQGKTRLILQNITTPLRALEGRQPFLYVGFDHASGAKMLAQEYIRRTGGKARFALLYGTRGYVSTVRGGAFLEALKPYPDMRMVSAYYVDFNREKARKAALEIIAETPDIDFIHAASTDIALGVIDALKETGKLGKIMVNGWGGGSAELEALRKGELDFTVMRMNDDNGVAMAEAIKLDLLGRGEKVPLIYSGAFRLIRKDTPAAKISDYMHYAFRYSR